MKASDLPDRAMLAVVAALTQEHEHATVTIWKVCEIFFNVPPKVVHAKLRRLIRRGLVDGCYCGCRGDFSLTVNGRQALDDSTPHNEGGGPQ